MSDLRYFLFYCNQSEVFLGEKELNEKVNVAFKNGVPLGEIWAIKGKRLQITIKELVATELK